LVNVNKLRVSKDTAVEDAKREKRESALKAKEINVNEASALFDESSRDEARHTGMLRGLLDRFFKEHKLGIG
jgi:rubrerythrin